MPTGLQLQSTLRSDGSLTLELAEVAARAPSPDEVVVRVEAAPINPSDQMTLLASGDLEKARFTDDKARPRVTLQLPPRAANARSRRFGLPLPIGLEGAGTVVSAGQNAQALMGKPVAFLSLTAGSFAQYLTLDAASCVPIPRQFSVRDCAALFVNPLTALAIAETARLEGEKALIHTAAASNLGQMLVKICLEDELELINIVRRPQQVALLRTIGARHVCNSSADSFHADLVAAIEKTGARIVFDAIGGGSTVHRILSAIETAASARLAYYNPYGSSERKQAYVYGHLDTTPMQLQHDHYGMQWGVNSWVMPSILALVSPDRNAALRQRAIDGARTTFASQFMREISLADALREDVMQAYTRQATGQKFLICPQQ